MIHNNGGHMKATVYNYKGRCDCSNKAGYIIKCDQPISSPRLSSYLNKGICTYCLESILCELWKNGIEIEVYNKSGD